MRSGYIFRLQTAAFCLASALKTQLFNVSRSVKPFLSTFQVSPFRVTIPKLINYSFNTQPCEGGCAQEFTHNPLLCGFNTQPPESGCITIGSGNPIAWTFQHTAARRRLRKIYLTQNLLLQFQHTAARRRLPSGIGADIGVVGFNTQPPEGGCFIPLHFCTSTHRVSTHSRPKAAAWHPYGWSFIESFQHTAARRRLRFSIFNPLLTYRFNTQPPEGGCSIQELNCRADDGFQHTAARRRLQDAVVFAASTAFVSTHSRPKAAAGNG